MQKWLPEPDAHIQRRAGKLLEECGELVQITARVTIQGLAGIDPKTGEVNRTALLKEMADVEAQLICTSRALDLSDFEMTAYLNRIDEKCEQMTEWERHYLDK